MTLPFARPSLLHLAAPSALVALVLAFGHEAPPPADVGSLAETLGQAAQGVVLPEDIRWEPSGGLLSDLLAGRWALFLASDAPHAPRDVWRARVRLTPEGRPLQVMDAHDLTSTPLGDDHALVVSGHRAAFATLAFGQEQSVTTLDVAGEGAQNTNVGLEGAVMSVITNVQQTGSAAGVARVDVTFEQPARAVGLALDDDTLAITYEEGRQTRHATLDLARGELTPPVAGLHSEPAQHLPKRLVFWAVDTVRAVPWIGPAPIAWLEDHFFELRDQVKQLAFRFRANAKDDAEDTLATVPSEAPEKAPEALLDGAQAGTRGDAEDAPFPPANLPTIWKSREPGEGEWVAPKLPWLRKTAAADASTPPAFVRTYVRPDEERPYAQVLLVAMDMRQLDLDMEAGSEDPKPLTGGTGPGHVPRDPRVYTRIVAAFNGAFKTEHGNYGMMVHKRVLLPPQPGAASVVVLRDGRVGLGSWGNTSQIGGIDGVAADDILSFRQNLDPLVDQGEVNPTRRALWGYTLPGSGTQTERSGMCVTSGGHLVYAWGDDVSATSLGKAMKAAGCSYGMHLDMNPHHTGFLFTTIDDLKAKKFRSEALTSLMEVSPDRYIDYAAKDFFYVMLHDPSPPPLATGGEGTAFHPDGGTQPAPAWMPGLWAAQAESPAGAVSLIDVEPQRATYRLRAGKLEPDAKTGATPLYELTGDETHRVLFSVGLGVSRDLKEHGHRGLATDGKVVLELGANAHAAGEGALVVRPDGTLSLMLASEVGAVDPHMDVAELPLLLDEGHAVASPSERSAPALRSALGVTPEGRTLLARGTLESDAPLAEVLQKAGCTRAVLLDRGVRGAQHFDRAGTGAPLHARYDETTLFGIAAKLMPRAFRFQAEAPLAAVAPKH